MKIVYSWLKDLVDISVSPQQLADALQSVGIEVAEVREFRVPQRVKVARIIDVQPHPNADRLRICSVEAGSPEPLQIVCGAPNARAGMVAPLAVEGAVLGADCTVKRAKLRGVESFGMLCSERELGISDEHAGLMELPAHYRPGDELSMYYPDDAVIEIEIVPSRGDCLSMVGVAREVAARYNLPLKKTAISPIETADDPVHTAIDVQVVDRAACPRYTGRLVRNITIGPSPDWMQRRLTLAGLRPINNIVDITNYLLLHFGQPMHAFDYRSIRGKRISVEKSGSAQRFTTLDGMERDLTESDLLIRDAERPVALAGIMGGAGSEISPSTTDVFIECAYFDPVTIRKTSKRLGLSTDSSYRFERGVDPESGLIDALDTAAALMQQLGHGTVSAGRIDSRPEPFERRVVSVRTSRVEKILGQQFTVDAVKKHLDSIGFTCEKIDSDTLRCIIPSFRHDCAIEEDLVEEIGRLHGYDAIPASAYARISLDTPIAPPERNADQLRYALAYAGFNEVLTNSLSSEKKRSLLTPDMTAVTLLNPLSPDMAEMRTTLAGSMLDVLVYNINRHNDNNRFFEIGKIYYREPSDGSFIERDMLGIVFQGDWFPVSWNNAPLNVDFFIVKGILSTIAHALGGSVLTIDPSPERLPLFDDPAVSVRIGNTIHGKAGRLSKTICTHYDLNTPVFFVELDITGFLAAPAVTPQYHPLPRFPAVLRDFCFVMDESVPAGAIADTIRSLSTLVESVTPFDLYRGDKLGSGLKSIAYNVCFRSSESTLTDKEIEPICSALIAAVKQKFDARLRT